MAGRVVGEIASDPSRLRAADALTIYKDMNWGGYYPLWGISWGFLA